MLCSLNPSAEHPMYPNYQGQVLVKSLVYSTDRDKAHKQVTVDGNAKKIQTCLHLLPRVSELRFPVLLRNHTHS